MNKREIKKRIYLTGPFGLTRPRSYRVENNMPGSSIVCWVASVKIGNAIVRALRELAYQENAK